MGTVWFSQLAVSLFLAGLLGGALSPVGCLSFNFPTFPHEYPPELQMSKKSRIFLDAIQVTPDSKGLKDLKDNSGRVFYETQFRLKSKSKGVTAAFNTTFILNITPQTSPGGEGMAFILAADTALPEASSGQWLGIVNATTNGSSQANVVAVEFDTRKSYPEDLDDNHVGLNVNSIYSIKRVSLADYSVNLSSAADVEARVQYDGKNISVFVSMTKYGTRQGMPVLSLPLNLSQHLPEKNEDNDYNNGIVYWLWELYRRERILDAVDSRLAGEFDEQGMVRMLVLGIACCHPNPHHRPSMKTVLQVLTGEAPLPPVPIERPSFVWPAMPPSFKQDPDISLIGGQLSPFTQLTGR
ncbi:hypothetical protein F2P56_009983 [Juglans regia]|uniref:Legume lectin domain-containing protein n=1 Tax=Juglans regia TaxID=51240 RepID=A0A833XXN0_JUGRE|nr:hypothetical protein F2P56_009983 [Juglans regia]